MTPSITIGTQLITVFKDSILKYTKDIKNEFLQIFMNGVGDYIDNYYEKYSKTKTFIYRDERVNFYDIYFPVTIKNDKSEVVSISDIKMLFDKIKFLTIIGTAGSGKSMLMKHIFLQTVKISNRIPIVIELRNLNDFNGTITDYVYKILTKNKLAASDKIIENLLTEGSYLFLLDGYDEIYSNTKNKITNEIEEFVDAYNMNTFVLTSRPGANAESLQRFDNYYVRPLDKKQINEFVHLQFKNHESKESVGKIITVISKSENNEYKDYLSNPLLLSMFIFTFNSYPELPRSRNKFYWNVFDTLCTKHDAFTKKGFWLHERRSKLLNEDFEKILQWFSYISIFKGKYNFDEDFLKTNLESIKNKLNLTCSIEDLIYDLTVSISILIQDGTDYTFPHKSLQEYFTALLIKNLNRQQKYEVYTNKLLNLYSNTTGGNSNLYKLCAELDRECFCKDFIIPNAKIFLSELSQKGDKELLVAYSRILNLSIMFFKSKEETDKFSLMGYSYKSIYIDSFYNYFNLDVLDVFEKESVINQFIPLIEKTLLKYNEVDENFNLKSINIKFCDECSDDVFEFAISTGIVSFIRSTINIIAEKLKKLEREMENELETTEDLLGL